MGAAVTLDKLIPLADAAKRVSSTLTESALRKERDRGNLRTWIIARKEFTTEAALSEMLEACRSATGKPQERKAPLPALEPQPDVETATAAALRIAEALRRGTPKQNRRRR